jgi:hypothetical protein
MIAFCISCPYQPLYWYYSLNYTAIGTSTVIAFSLLRQNGYFAIDDVSVESFAAPGVNLIVNGGFETGSLSSWVYCNQNNGSNTGAVEANSTHFNYLGMTYYPHSGSYYYIGGGITVADYISQTFPTVIGQIYNVGMWVLNAGSGQTSAALFLGV